MNSTHAVHSGSIYITKEINLGELKEYPEEFIDWFFERISPKVTYKQFSYLIALISTNSSKEFLKAHPSESYSKHRYIAIKTNILKALKHKVTVEICNSSDYYSNHLNACLLVNSVHQYWLFSFFR